MKSTTSDAEQELREQIDDLKHFYLQKRRELQKTTREFNSLSELYTNQQMELNNLLQQLEEFDCTGT